MKMKLFIWAVAALGTLVGLAEFEQKQFHILGFRMGDPIDVDALPITLRHRGRLFPRNAPANLTTNQWISFKISEPVGIFDEVRLHYENFLGTNVLDRIVLSHQYDAHTSGEDVLAQLKDVADSVKKQYCLIGNVGLSDFHFADSTSWVGYRKGLTAHVHASKINARWSLTLRLEYDPGAISQKLVPFDAQILTIPNSAIFVDFEATCKSNKIESAKTMSLYNNVKHGCRSEKEERKLLIKERYDERVKSWKETHENVTITNKFEFWGFTFGNTYAETFPGKDIKLGAQAEGLALIDPVVNLPVKRLGFDHACIGFTPCTLLLDNINFYCSVGKEKTASSINEKIEKISNVISAEYDLSIMKKEMKNGFVETRMGNGPIDCNVSYTQGVIYLVVSHRDIKFGGAEQSFIGVIDEKAIQDPPKGNPADEFESVLPIKSYGIFTIGKLPNFEAKVHWVKKSYNAEYHDTVDGVPFRIWICRSGDAISSIEIEPVNEFSDKVQAEKFYRKFKKMIDDAGVKGHTGLTAGAEGDMHYYPNHYSWTSPTDPNVEMSVDMQERNGKWRVYLFLKDLGHSSGKKKK